MQQGLLLLLSLALVAVTSSSAARTLQQRSAPNLKLNQVYLPPAAASPAVFSDNNDSFGRRLMNHHHVPVTERELALSELLAARYLRARRVEAAADALAAASKALDLAESLLTECGGPLAAGACDHHVPRRPALSSPARSHSRPSTEDKATAVYLLRSLGHAASTQPRAEPAQPAPEPVQGTATEDTTWWWRALDRLRQLLGPMCLPATDTPHILYLLDDFISLPPCPPSPAESELPAPATTAASPTSSEPQGAAFVEALSFTEPPGNTPQPEDDYGVEDDSSVPHSIDPDPRHHLVHPGMSQVGPQRSWRRSAMASHGRRRLHQQGPQVPPQGKPGPGPNPPPLPADVNINVPGWFKMTRDPKTGETTTRVGSALLPIVTINGVTPPPPGTAGSVPASPNPASPSPATPAVPQPVPSAPKSSPSPQASNSVPATQISSSGPKKS